MKKLKFAVLLFALILLNSIHTGASAQTTYPYDEFYKTYPLHQFEFKPDNTGFYFLKSDGKVENIFEYDLQTKAITQVTNYDSPVAKYLVDPTNRYLYLQKDRRGSGSYSIFKFDLETQETTPVIQLGYMTNDLCGITKDGKTLFFTQIEYVITQYSIKSLNLDSNLTTTLKNNQTGLFCSQLNSTENLLSFYVSDTNSESQVGYINLKTMETVYLTDQDGVSNLYPTFDDAHHAIYYRSDKDSDIANLWKFDLDLHKSTTVPMKTIYGVESLQISPDQKMSVLTYRDTFSQKTKIFNGVLGKEKIIPVNGVIKGAKFNSENLGIITARVDPSPDLYYLYQNGNVSLFYDSNQSKIKSSEFSKTKSVFVPSFDGLKIPTHFFIPNTASSTNKMPVIFWIHGGPNDISETDFSAGIQYLNNQGFIVIAPNYRGSKGFGRKFQLMINGGWGGDHIKDILAVENYAKTNFNFVDTDNFFILGGSFGGFSVLSLITQYPDRFRAAVDVFGISELSSFLNAWSKEAQETWIKMMGHNPKKDNEFNTRVSPIYHVENIVIPLQIQQGANDPRVLKSQSDTLVKIMRSANKSVEYIVYPDEGHGFDKFENKKKSVESMADFFRRNIQMPLSSNSSKPTTQRN